MKRTCSQIFLGASQSQKFPLTRARNDSTHGRSRSCLSGSFLHVRGEDAEQLQPAIQGLLASLADEDNVAKLSTEELSCVSQERDRPPVKAPPLLGGLAYHSLVQTSHRGWLSSRTRSHDECIQLIWKCEARGARGASQRSKMLRGWRGNKKKRENHKTHDPS